jgi:hypothetical protein
MKMPNAKEIKISFTVRYSALFLFRINNHLPDMLSDII